jgi:endonuclease YncB( thermonuclease family)
LRGWVDFAVAFALTAASGGLVFAADQKPCAPLSTGTGHVVAAIDGRTLTLADGRTVRLAGIEAPDNARSALEALVSGHDVSLMTMGPQPDRYGRIVALVALNGDGGPSVQEKLLIQGDVWMSAGMSDSGCIRAFQAAEKAGRDAERGVWNDPDHPVWDAGNPLEILDNRGHFAVVEGTVLSVRESGGSIYVNFGKRWSEDFTVTVLKRNERNFLSAGMELKKLAGRHVRVRGLIEERGGPWIEAAHPEQIEVAERP